MRNGIRKARQHAHTGIGGQDTDCSDANEGKQPDMLRQRLQR
ncbi:hypothetical protein [Xanthomonas cucurbitae]|nr:hypothetical protein [Xanthomonas cucurbitae]